MAMGLISLLFDTASARAFSPIAATQCMYHGVTFVLFVSHFFSTSGEVVENQQC